LLNSCYGSQDISIKVEKEADLYFLINTDSTEIPRFTSLIHSSKIVHKAKTRKTKITFREEVPGTMISLKEEGARFSENWLVN
jgi:histidinol phosphatase-like PHP family hydrolase